MTGKPHPEVEVAVEAVKAGMSRLEASRTFGVSLTGLRSALRRHKVAPLARGRPPKTP